MSDFWKKTAECYANYIEYPQMNEKYLQRPPFKYILAIILSTHAKTNFLEGLFEEEELNKDAYGSSEKKIMFLEKIIKFIYKVLDKNVPLNPKNVVKGVECDKTNYFLQDIYEVAVSGITFKTLGGKLKKQTSNKNDNEDKNRKNITAKENRESTKEKEVVKESAPKIPKKLEQKKSIKEKDIENAEKKKTDKNKEKVPEQEHSKIVQEVVDKVEKEKKILAKSKSKEPKIQNIKMGNINTNGYKIKNESEELVYNLKKLDHEEIKQIIQKITQNSNPLGKLVEFIDDDLEKMNKEAKKWKTNFLETAQKLEILENKHDQELKSYHDKIIQIEEQIFDQTNKVLNAKSKILKNQQKIDSLLTNLI
jgi:hypothetical protein